MFTTDKDKKLYDSWSKKDIYEAYLLERQARVNITDTANKLRRELAEARYNAKIEEDKQAFKKIVRENIIIEADIEEDLEVFFKLNYKIVWLNGQGLMGYTTFDDFYFINYTFSDKKLSNTKAIYKKVKELAKEKKVLYSADDNPYKNNSIEIEKDTFEIVL